MIADDVRRLRMFAGPNGSGKTSLVYRLAREFTPHGFFKLHSFINADDIFADLKCGRGIDFHEFGLNLETDAFFAALRAIGRLAQEHRFFRRAKVVDSRLTVPDEGCDPYVAAAVADFLRYELLAAN